MRTWILSSLCCCALLAQPAWGYGYSREEDPLLKSFRAAVKFARAGDLAAARKEAQGVRWQLDELETKEDLSLSYGAAFNRAHAPGTKARDVIVAWSNLLYLALLQKFHWNLKEQLDDYHKARARLDSALAYYELALAGNVRRADAARKEKDPKARSRHADVVAQFKAAQKALGSPGLFGAGKRSPDLKAFRAATTRILGHLAAVFPTFTRPKPRQGSKKPKGS